LIEGAHDSAVFIKTMLLVLVMHPECQRKAWEEIDRVVGPDRLPTYADMDNLPYTRAIIQEVSSTQLVLLQSFVFSRRQVSKETPSRVLRA
jgi:hypothetical protein